MELFRNVLVEKDEQTECSNYFRNTYVGTPISFITQAFLLVAILPTDTIYKRNW